MLQDYRKDSLVSFLVGKCSLTKAQLDTIMLSRIPGKLDDKVKLRDKKKVSKGSFLRTLRQGQSNIEASLCTILLLQYLGLVGHENIASLSRIGLLISQLQAKSPDPLAIQSLMKAIEEFVRKFSHRNEGFLD